MAVEGVRVRVRVRGLWVRGARGLKLFEIGKFTHEGPCSVNAFPRIVDTLRGRVA